MSLMCMHCMCIGACALNVIQVNRWRCKKSWAPLFLSRNQKVFNIQQFARKGTTHLALLVHFSFCTTTRAATSACLSQFHHFHLRPCCKSSIMSVSIRFRNLVPLRISASVTLPKGEQLQTGSSSSRFLCASTSPSVRKIKWLLFSTRSSLCHSIWGKETNSRWT